MDPSDVPDAIRRAVELPPHVQRRVRFEARRKAWHVVAAILAVPVLLLAPLAYAVSLALFGVVAITAANLVLDRRLPKVEPVHSLVTEPIGRAIVETRRAGERYPWAPVLFLVSLVACAVGTRAMGLPFAYAFAAYGILGLGDAASALIGIAYGKRRLAWNARKTVEGTFAGFAGGFGAAVVFAAADYAFRGEVLPEAFLLVALAGALVGAALETMPGVQDNLVVPVGAWAVMVGLGVALGVV